MNAAAAAIDLGRVLHFTAVEFAWTTRFTCFDRTHTERKRKRETVGTNTHKERIESQSSSNSIAVGGVCARLHAAGKSSSSSSSGGELPAGARRDLRADELTESKQGKQEKQQ